MCSPLSSLCFLVLGAASLSAASPPTKLTSAQVEFFESKIRPVLVAECYDCHGAKKAKGGLRLDSREAMLEGGDSGALFVPGDPDKSLLIQSLAHATPDADLHMPKEGAKFAANTMADFREWVRQGAPDPRDKPEPVLTPEQSWEQALATRKQWWCFQPVKATAPLSVLKASWSAHPVDRFLLARQEAVGLQPVGNADAATIIRRATFVLTGLPPTPEEIAAFQREFSKDAEAALGALVDRLLASPRFGETWARHWMDWVRYAESHGSEGDAAIPYAWRYRDYLIRAFNADVRYPQLVREAIAGDLLVKPRINAELGINESALGIGHLRMVLHGFSPTDSLDELVTFTDNQIDTVTKAFQALTVSCARCHNHKFDAISQADFYSLYGIFTSTRPAVVDVNLPDVGRAQRDELMQIKSEIKKLVSEAWLRAAQSLPALPVKPAAPMPADVLHHWEVGKTEWYADGQGLGKKASRAGEFSLALDGEKVVEHVHPSGYFTDLLSTQDRGVLMSPRIRNEGGTLWIRAAGGGAARARYIVQNYPRTGTIHKAKELNDATDGVLGWRQLDLNYWKGDDIFIECTTVADQPVETKLDARSWFGITEVVITKGTTPPPAKAPGGNPLEAVTAWMQGSMTDAQAELLEHLLQSGKLPNDTKTLPGVAALLARYRKVESDLPLPTRAPGVLEADGHDAPLFVLGDHKQPAALVPRRFLDGINPTKYNAENSGRLELAESLVNPANPLTSRVIVNRLWQYVFGKGLVTTPDNFGRLGDPPSHPELLDYLADRFTREGGSIKGMLKLLITSKTFQLDSSADPEVAIKDPENTLLTHFSVRRLEAEAIRDSILAVSGKLADTMYGQSVAGNDARRSVYVRVVRNNLDDFLTAFDAPVPSSSRGKRDSTNVPAQSLALLNDPKVINWTTAWGLRTYKDRGVQTDAARVQRMFAQAFGRAPSDSEVAQSLAFITASAQQGEEQAQTLAKLESEHARLLREIDLVLGPVRERLTKTLADSSPPIEGKVPEPFAEWDFEDGPADLEGRLPLTLTGGARIEHGMLILDGGKSLARSAALPMSLKAKTLEAWVILDELEQRGAGILTVQDREGVVFDSIVFGEKDPGCWLPGSNNFKRTRSLEGPVEREAASRPVHIAITYDLKGRIVGYRDGQRYGEGYKMDEVATFDAGKSEVLLGCRHGSGGGNRTLKGRILRARLYDRALKPDQIEVSRRVERTVVTERDVMDALTDAERSKVREWQTEVDALNRHLTALRGRVERARGPEQAWASLALALVNLKEFIYLK